MSEDAQARPTRDAPEPLYDVKYPDAHERGARANIGRPDLDRDPVHPGPGTKGYPYCSFVTVAFDNRNPIFLISGLAEHTKNLERDPRASLLTPELLECATASQFALGTGRHPANNDVRPPSKTSPHTRK
jgi:hypothetical protein